MSAPQPAPANGEVSRSASPAVVPTSNTATNQPKSATTNASTGNTTRRNTPADAVDSEATHPLMATERTNPPLANPERDDDPDDREVVHRPYPGVDDGFFPARANGDGPTVIPPDVENVPKTAPRPRPAVVVPEIPSEDDDDRRTHTTRGHTPRIPLTPNPRHDARVPEFVGSERPFPTYNEMEFGTIAPDLESLPDVNVYQHKKTLAQGMMDLALFSANANQLRYVLDSSSHPYYYSGIVLISISLIFQVGVGVGLIWNARYNVKDEKEICIANKINNFTVIGIFLITVINVFISAFGVASVQPVVVRPGPT